MLPFILDNIFLRNTESFWQPTLFFSLMYQELHFLKFILKVESLVNKSVNEITVLKFIGVIFV